MVITGVHMYIGFVNGGLEILWCEYLWVATSLCGGGGPSPPRKFRNMKCSRSDSKSILGLLTVSSKFTRYIYDIFLKTLLIFHKESKIELFFHNYLN